MIKCNGFKNIKNWEITTFSKKIKKFNLNKRAAIYLTKFVVLKNPNGLHTIP